MGDRGYVHHEGAMNPRIFLPGTKSFGHKAPLLSHIIFQKPRVPDDREMGESLKIFEEGVYPSLNTGEEGSRCPELFLKRGGAGWQSCGEWMGRPLNGDRFPLPQLPSFTVRPNDHHLVSDMDTPGIL